MKYAVISDIHANIYALEAVLNDLEKRRVDQIVVNGDLVNRGPGNLAVLERLQQLDCVFIMGNHDDLIRLWSTRDPQLPAQWLDDPFWAAIDYTVKEIADAGWIDFLATMKMEHRIELQDLPQILITHGSPRHYRDGYAPYSPPEMFAHVVANFPTDIYIGSHTHRPWQMELHDKTFLNTGAVGTPFNRKPQAQYLILENCESLWHFEFCQVDYDRQAALAAFSGNGFLENGGVSGTIFYQELKYSRPIFDPFWRWAEKEKIAKDWQAWETFLAAFPNMLCHAEVSD